MAKQESKTEVSAVNKAEVEAGLLNKKMQKFEWKGDKLVAITCPDGTRLEFDDLKVLPPKHDS